MAMRYAFMGLVTKAVERWQARGSKSADGSLPMTDEIVLDVLRGLAQLVSRDIDEVDGRVKALEKREPSIERVDLAQDENDYRRTVRTETWSDGRRFVSHLRSDAPLFLGPYQRDKRYGCGDWVVFGGSTWACLSETADAPGTNTPTWMIVARKGRDGR